MYNPIREEAKKLGYRVSNFDREMKVTGVRVTPKGYCFKVNQLGVESTITVSKALQSCLGLLVERSK